MGKNYILIGVIIIILIITGYFFYQHFSSQPSNSNVQPKINQEQKSVNKSITDVVKLCEVENPRFNPREECQKVIDEKYPNRDCSFEFGPTEWMPMGSCRNCTIACK